MMVQSILMMMEIHPELNPLDSHSCPLALPLLKVMVDHDRIVIEKTSHAKYKMYVKISKTLISLTRCLIR